MALYQNPLFNTVFVFGSNLAGTHADGAAAFAVKNCDAQFGVGEGPTGKSYAVPIQNEHLDNLSLVDIQWYVEQFLAYARTQRDTRFQVARIGCDTIGFTDSQIATMFKKISDNVFLSGRWMALNRQLNRARLFVGGDVSIHADRIEKTLNECTAPWGQYIEVVTTGVGAVNDIVRAWARRRDLPWTPFLSDEHTFGSDAEKMLDAQLAWYCTHAIFYQNNMDGICSRRVDHMQKEGLKVRTFHN